MPTSGIFWCSVAESYSMQLLLSSEEWISNILLYKKDLVTLFIFQ